MENETVITKIEDIPNAKLRDLMEDTINKSNFIGFDNFNERNHTMHIIIYNDRTILVRFLISLMRDWLKYLFKITLIAEFIDEPKPLKHEY